jgi:uncharacterized membrane protein YgcG
MRRYSPISTKLTSTGKRIYNTVRYPEIPRSLDDIYVYTSIGDRFDTLAEQYYDDSSLWWIISIANGNTNQSSLTPPLGQQIRIPSNPSAIIANYENLNPSTTTSTSGTGGSSGGSAGSSGGSSAGSGGGGGGGY